MKHIFTFVLCLLCFSVKSQTTEKDYLYMTKGYWTAISSGLDLNADYKPISIGSVPVDGFQIDYYNMMRVSTQKTCGIMVSISGGSGSWVYCIPYKNDSLFVTFLSEVDIELDKPLKYAFMKSLAAILADYSDVSLSKELALLKPKKVLKRKK